MTPLPSLPSGLKKKTTNSKSEGTVSSTLIQGLRSRVHRDQVQAARGDNEQGLEERRAAAVTARKKQYVIKPRKKEKCTLMETRLEKRFLYLLKDGNNEAQSNQVEELYNDQMFSISRMELSVSKKLRKYELSESEDSQNQSWRNTKEKSRSDITQQSLIVRFTKTTNDNLSIEIFCEN
ncbi:hypothetical protein WN51_07598 [Melipona quadrifasciata]|uniref:Uncharacterized protein n=1 Tax=Melipona quadrifasciata TaxID=166423 RepID=A0A0N0BBS0_9HYME|nr:hypothetical protein WN51_07598 [Melipona quadrifasciata]